MTKEQNNFASKIKYYHILILGCMLCPLIIINSNHVNSQRAEEKLNEEKRKLFDKIIYGRKLDADEEPESENSEDDSEKIDKVCKKGSEELRTYYKTKNLGDIKLKEGGIECEDKDKEYMKALINILKSKLGGEEEEEDNNNGGRRRNLGEDEDEKEGGEISQDDIIAYGKHLLPVLIFLVVAILCIPGWLICCFCCCCKCYCCCCCKKKCCRIPCFVITYALYALVVAVSIYGVSQSNHIFVGIADTECSILRFFEEISEGEVTTETPRWAGFEGISGLLDGLSQDINNMKAGTMSDLDEQTTNISNYKRDFTNLMKASGDKFYQSSSEPTEPRTNFIVEYSGDFGGQRFVLDLVKMFGKYNSNAEPPKYEPKNSLLDTWELEFKAVSETADGFMGEAKSGFNDILGESSAPITNALEKGQDVMGQLQGTFDDIKGPINDIIVDNSETIEEYGKLGIKAVFGVLALINVAMAAFMLLLCFCSGKCCNKCCCCRCICKCFTHLLWNILALLMIIVFLVGSLFALIGRVGSDAMSVISYVLSDDNIKDGGDGILVDKLAENKKYINICIGGDGKIEEELGFGDTGLGSFEQIRTAEQQIADSKRMFIENKDFRTYKFYKGELEKRANLTETKLCLIKEDAEIDLENIDMDSPDILSFFKTLTEMNSKISSETEHKDSWSVEEGDINKKCNNGESQEGFEEPNVFHPQECYPSNRNWIKDLTTPGPDIPEISSRAKIIGETLKFVENTKKNADVSKDYLKIINKLKDEYEKFLDSYLVALDKFNTTIKTLTSKLDEYTGTSSSLFSFANCAFVGTNLKIILKYLKDSFGGDVYTIGVCLILSGCSLALSISFTILLIMVINASVDENKNNVGKGV